MAAKRNVAEVADVVADATPEPAVESVAAPGEGGVPAEDDTSAGPATTETASPKFVFVTPSGQEIDAFQEALNWVDSECDGLLSRLDGRQMGVLMAVLHNRRARAALLGVAGQVGARFDYGARTPLTPEEALSVLRGLVL